MVSIFCKLLQSIFVQIASYFSSQAWAAAVKNALAVTTSRCVCSEQGFRAFQMKLWPVDSGSRGAILLRPVWLFPETSGASAGMEGRLPRRPRLRGPMVDVEVDPPPKRPEGTMLRIAFTRILSSCRLFASCRRQLQFRRYITQIGPCSSG